MTQAKKGLFITLEGAEGSGKTTNVEVVAQLLDDHAIPYQLTREPGGTKLGESLRAVLLNPDTGEMAPESELLLMFTARLEHVRQVIQPALDRGEWVICDRFTDSSYAYQGGGRGLAFAKIEMLEKWCLGDFKPDITLLFEVALEVAMQRVVKRGQLDRFEDQENAFFERVNKAFFSLAKNNASRYRIIDGNKTIEQVKQQVITTLEPLIVQWQQQ